MKKIALIGMVFLAVFPFLGFAQSGSYDQRSYARMSYVKGDVYVQRGQDLGFEQGEVNLVVVTGDKLGTRDGRLEIQLGDRNYLRLDNYTQIDVVNLPARDGDTTKIHVISGSAFVRVNNLVAEKSFELHSPDASFYLLEEGLYRLDVRENRETEFSVLSGQAEAAGEEGSVLVKSGEQVIVANGRFVSQPMSVSLRRDEFNSWNETRDALFARRVARSYLPAEYSDYESELADNGRWTYESSYGYVWVPTVSYADWRPYSYGRWVWYPIIGWTWVSHEPWGWCTSHFGRWGWGLGLGWYWIPQNHWAWGPAWVHWYWDNDYIGWCPLSYYNYPAVIVNNYFYDRYSDNYFPNNSRSLTMVHRNQLQNRRISDVALSRSRIDQMGRLSLRGMQPQVRPEFNRNGDIANRAKSVLSRENLRSVNKSFSAGSDVRSSLIRRSGDSASGVVKDNRFVPREGTRQGNAETRTAPENRMNAPRVSPGLSNPRDVSPDATKSRQNQDSNRVIRSYPSERNSGGAVPRSQERTGSNLTNRSGASTFPRTNEKNMQNALPGRDSVNRDTFREFPSRGIDGSKNSSAVRPGTPVGGQSTEGRRTFSSSPGVNSGNRTGTGKSSVSEYQPRGMNAPSSQREPSSRAIKERSPSSGLNSSRSSVATNPQRNSSPAKNENSRSYDSQRRIAPRSDSSSSKGYSSSPNYGSSSRSYNTPSKGYSSSPSYASPSRSSSAPSRSYSSPSRSINSSPGRSNMSAPSRSYSAPSRSYSAPSRGSGSSSGSSGGSSRSSSGSSSSSSKGSSSSQSSGGGGGGRKK